MIAHSSAAEPCPAHPLAGARPAGPRVAVVILVIWLSCMHWSAEQVLAVLLLLTPTGARLGSGS